MTYTQLRKEMRICRCVYRGTTDALPAFKKNFERINKTYRVADYEYQVWLAKYNEALYRKAESRA